MTIANDLIEEALLSWRDARRQRHRTTLPELLAGLATGDVVEFSEARPHQFHPWSMFLTQLAAHALHRAGVERPPHTEAEWRALLLGLTNGAHEPWALVVTDLSQPAFFQPPVPEGEIADWNVYDHPDDLDMLVTSKNHDVKQSQISGDDVEAWILALVTLQTMQGYPGRGYNGIARMKSGYGSRPRVGLMPDQSLGKRFQRDIEVMLESWDRLIDRGFANDGAALLWTCPWNGESALSLDQLAPHFIEVCWRTRCVAIQGQIECRYTTTATRRSLPERIDGDVGDPWIPIAREGGALTVGAGGFDHVLMRKIALDGFYEPASAQRPRLEDDKAMWFSAAVLARGQGKTEGLHERALLFTAKASRWMADEDTRLALARRADVQMDRAVTMRSKVLYPALRQLALGEGVPADHFHERVDELFFAALFGDLELAEEEAQLHWDQQLDVMARAELQSAIERAVVPTGRWYRAITAAEGMYRGCLARQFPTVSTARGQSQGDTTR